MTKLKTIINNIVAIEESSNLPLMVIDVQPGHENGSTRKKFKIILDYVFEEIERGREVIYIHNGPDVGYEDTAEVKRWLYNQCIERGYEDSDDIIYNIEFHDKVYGFFRAWMSFGYEDDFIIEFMQHLIKNNIFDSRELDETSLSDEIHQLLLKYDMEVDDILLDDNIYQPDLIDVIKRLRGKVELIGGGVDECLAEVELLFQILNKKYIINNRYTY